MTDEQTKESTGHSGEQPTGQSSLTGKQLDHLRGLAHSLKPVITVGNSGVSAAVVDETNRALSHHELIKVRLPAIDRKERRKLLDELAQSTTAAVVQTVGRIGTLYRGADEPRIELPKPARQKKNQS